MDRDSVSSSMIASIGYDQSSGTLEIEFKPNRQVWQYYDVPEIINIEFRRAESLGKYFHAMIKKQYKEARVG